MALRCHTLYSQLQNGVFNLWVVWVQFDRYLTHTVGKEKGKSIPFRIGVVWGMHTDLWPLSSKVKCVSSLGDKKMLLQVRKLSFLSCGLTGYEDSFEQTGILHLEKLALQEHENSGHTTPSPHFLHQAAP